MKTPIAFTETDHLVKLWHYLLLLLPIFLEPMFIFIAPLIFVFITIIRHSPIKLINTKINSYGIKYSTSQLLNKGFIPFDKIKNYKLIVFEKVFDLKLYKYCNGSRISSIKHGLELNLTDNRKIIIPTKKPHELINTLNQLTKTSI